MTNPQPRAAESSPSAGEADGRPDADPWDSLWDPFAEPLRVTIVGEGSDDHGDLGRGPNLVLHGAGDPCGVLGELVARLIGHLCAPAMLAAQARGWFGSPRLACQFVRWRPVDRLGKERLKGPVTPGEMLVDRHLTERLLENLLYPISRIPAVSPVEGVILVADGEYATHLRAVEAALHSAPRYADRAAWIVVLPELEELLLQSPAALASGLDKPVQLIGAPPPASGQPEGQPKERFTAWCCACDSSLRPTHVNGALKARVASHLDVTPAGPLASVPGWQDLVRAVERFIAKKMAARRRP